MTEAKKVVAAKKANKAIKTAPKTAIKTAGKVAAKTSTPAKKTPAAKTTTKPEKVKKANGVIQLTVFPKTQFKDLPALKESNLVDYTKTKKAMLEAVKKAGKPLSLSDLKSKLRLATGRVARTTARYAHKEGEALLYKGEGRFFLGLAGDIVKSIELAPSKSKATTQTSSDDILG